MFEKFDHIIDLSHRILAELKKIEKCVCHGNQPPPRAPRHVRAELHILQTWHHHRSNTMRTATIIWVDPVNRTDGSPIAPDTFTVNVFDDASPTPNSPIASIPSGVQTFTTDVLSVGVHNFVLTAVDSEGDASVPSSPPASVTVPVTLAHPNPPTSVAATLNA